MGVSGYIPPSLRISTLEVAIADDILFETR